MTDAERAALDGDCDPFLICCRGAREVRDLCHLGYEHLGLDLDTGLPVRAALLGES